ncbi:hypothetical protein KCU78_g17053, partial [Aureobasidium melanogenum]
MPSVLVDEVVNYAPGEMVPWHFMPSIIVASFFASLSGTLLTIELLQRKRLGKSLMSRVHLFACSSAEISIHSFVWRRLLDVACGLMAGLSIVSMHYVGNLGISNYTLTYPRRYIVAACIIAVGDSTIALALFFYFKERWISVWWKRCLCALLLAVGVCGMHFTASVGCQYQLKRIPPEAAPDARNTPVIVAATMCFVAALSCLLILFYVRYRNAVLANRAQHMMLACAYFDEHGNIMVTNEGTLPSQRIAKRFVLQKFDDHFGIHHPVWFWIWKVSSDWNSVADLIPRMRVHLQRTNVNTGYNTAASSRSSIYDEESYHDSTVLFREGYCVAAADLAAQLQVPLVDGLGQLLFYTRRLSPHEIDHYTAAGFRFAPLNRVEGAIANTMQIPIGLLAIQMQRVQDFAYRTSVPCPPKQGTFFVCLAALARVRDSFRVLVPMDRQDEMPDVQVSPYHMNSQQLSWLKRYNNWPAERFIWHIKLKEQNWSTLEDDEEKAFLIMLRTALGSLVTKIGERWFMDLVFCAEPITIRYGANKAQRD